MITSVAVIIPARNEEANIARIVPALMSRYDRQVCEIILVDDNSTDETWKKMQKLAKHVPKVSLIRRSPPSGVGYALRDGITHLSKKARYVLFMDCDFIANIKDIGSLFAKMNGVDGVVGSRFLTNHRRINYPIVKLIVNRTYHAIATFLLGFSQNDFTNNFKLYTRSLVDTITPLLSADDFGINAETGLYPLIMKAKIIEVPVGWKERTTHMGFSKFKIIRVGPSYLRVLFRCFTWKYFRPIVGKHYQ